MTFLSIKVRNKMIEKPEYIGSNGLINYGKKKLKPIIMISNNYQHDRFLIIHTRKQINNASSY